MKLQWKYSFHFIDLQNVLLFSEMNVCRGDSAKKKVISFQNTQSSQSLPEAPEGFISVFHFLADRITLVCLFVFFI